MSQELSDYDRHPFDPYVKALANKWLILAFCFVAAVAGLTLSVQTGVWLWLSRFGAVITVAGLLLTMSPVFHKGIYISQSDAGKLAEKDEHGKTMITSEDDRRIGRSVFTGILISIIGTVIWGFGDLVPVLL